MLAMQSDATFNLKTRNRCRLWVSLITRLVNGLEWNYGIDNFTLCSSTYPICQTSEEFFIAGKATNYVQNALV